jgi:peroxiredoxin
LLLKTQDLSLDLALSGDAADELLAGSTAAVALPDGSIRVSFADYDMTVTFDPSTHLIRRVVLDKSQAISQRGANVKQALVTIDYTTCAPDAAVTAKKLAFTPPPTADLQPGPPLAALDLPGKPMPPLTFQKLDGTTVSVADLHGSVYVLDFWATWCGDCMVALPEIDALYQHKKSEGLKVFAVNEQEETATVRTFVAHKNFSMPVLLDSDGKAGEALAAEELPETIVVGKDGVIRNVFLGMGNQAAIATAVATALVESPPGK